MKKVLGSISILVITSILVGCHGDSSNNAVAKEEITVTISLFNDKKEMKSEDISILKGTTLEEAMIENFSAETKNGMITKIDGHEQDESKSKYWLFDVNGEFSNVGAADYELQEKDKVDWKLESLTN